MQIHGFVKTTLLDYPKHVAATIFTGGCNFRCPFCHNGNLVLHPNNTPTIPEQEILSYLEKRKHLLDGVCITGGEPTLQPDLITFITKIKHLGLLVKLDTNGYQPDVLKELLEQHLLDYVAMDIKNSKEKYAITTSLPNFDIERINASIHLLQNGGIPYEFRTTVVKQLHSEEDMLKISEWIKHTPAYFLQSYKENEHVISPGFSAYSKEELLHIKNLILSNIPTVEIRGVD